MVYTFDNYVRAWVRSAFGVFAAFAVYYALNSAFLGVLTFAFLFFIPLSDRNTETTTNRIIFGVLMFVLIFWAFGFGGADIGLGLDMGVDSGITGGYIFLLFGICLGVGVALPRGNGAKMPLYIASLVLVILFLVIAQPWNWNTTAIVFSVVWLVSLIAGLSSEPMQKGSIGIFIIILAIVLYSFGVGTQDVGSAFFGQWWPTVNTAWGQISGPISSAIAPLTSTIGDAWKLMTNPVGYATQLMSGTYATNPGGKTGVYGADVTSFTVEKVFVKQPYMITAIVENSGASIAKNMIVRLDVDIEKLGGLALRQVSDLGIQDSVKGDTAEDKIPDMQKLGAQQFIFQSDGGITCAKVNQFDLRKKSVPLKLTATYQYESDSHVFLEFIKQSEWDRLATENKLKTTDTASEYSSSPIKFPIGTAGLKQPMITTQIFNIGLRLEAEADKSRIENVNEVTLEYPVDFKIKDCVPNTADKGTKGIVKWTDSNTASLKTMGTKILFCTFEKLGDEKMGSSPTKTYEVKAHSVYNVSNWKTASLALNFGGLCCSNSDCQSTQVCNDCTCVPKTNARDASKDGCKDSDAASETTTLASLIGKDGYCSAYFTQTMAKCDIGRGGCSSNEDCAIDVSYIVDSTGSFYPLACRTDVGAQSGVCCPAEAQAEQCKAASDAWIAGRSDSDIKLALLDARK